jgi:hypothetical protein
VVDSVVRVLEDVLKIVETRTQNVDWAGGWWDEAGDMVADLRDHLSRLRRADTSRMDELRTLFLPTGPLQDVSISSGWGTRYVELAARFDAASAGT